MQTHAQCPSCVPPDLEPAIRICHTISVIRATHARMRIYAAHGEEAVAGPVADFVEAGGNLLGEAFVVGDLVH